MAFRIVSAYIFCLWSPIVIRHELILGIVASLGLRAGVRLNLEHQYERISRTYIIGVASLPG
jgi:hypothetical protein